jgi:hypothetical protein
MCNVVRAAPVAVIGLFTVLGCAHAPPAEPRQAAVPKAPAPDDPYLQCSVAAEESKSDEARHGVGACRAAADAGSSTAAFNVCRILRDNPDLSDAKGWVSWCERAAAQDHPIAQYVLAVHYAAVRDPRAPELLRKSACGGFPPALEAISQLPVAGAGAPACPEQMGLDGTWEGTLGIVARDHEGGPTQQPVVTRLTIRGDVVSVKVLLSGAWKDIKPESFQIRRHKATAVIQAIDDGWDDDGNWIEGWVFTVSIVDHEHLRAVYHRVVNNANAPRGSHQAVWWYMAAGDLKRSAGPKE